MSAAVGAQGSCKPYELKKHNAFRLIIVENEVELKREDQAGEVLLEFLEA